MDLRNKVVVITGASGGIGRCVAVRLAKDGAKLALVARNPEALQAVADEIRASGGQAEVFPADLSAGEQIRAMVASVLDRFGTADVLVNSAFWGPPASLEETDEEFWDKTMHVTLRGAFLCTRAVVPTLRAKGGGRIVNIGSKAGKVGEDNRTAYCAAKWGLEGLTAALQEELTRDNIHVHLVSPAATDTPWWPEVGAELSEQAKERMIPPEVIAEAVHFVLVQPDQVHIPDLPVYNFRNPFEGKGSPFEK